MQNPYSPLQPHERIIVALDVSDVSVAIELADTLFDHVGGFKIGLEFFTSTYARLVSFEDLEEATELLQNLRELFALTTGKLFWDGKWCDIPNTVGAAANGLQPLQPKFCNVHASAGGKAIAAAVAGKGTSKVLGVTLLTSIDEPECRSIYGDNPDKVVVEFACLLAEAGADGIICSPRELDCLAGAAQSIVDEYAKVATLLKVTPGIRPTWSAKGDQARITTPADAVKNGADYLVIGRPITNPPAKIGTPVDAAKRIADEIAMATTNA